jgi:hypothetical protein
MHLKQSYTHMGVERRQRYTGNKDCPGVMGGGGRRGVVGGLMNDGPGPSSQGVFQTKYDTPPTPCLHTLQRVLLSSDFREGPPTCPPRPIMYMYVQWLTHVSVWQDELWTVMEYMEGGSLADTLKERRLSEKADPGTAKKVLALKRTFQNLIQRILRDHLRK